MSTNAQIKEAMQAWESKYAADFSNERKKEFVTESGIPLKRFYTPLDLEAKGFDFLKDVGFPGDYPMTANITATGYRGKLWEPTQYSGRALPEESNQLWKKMVEAGTNTVYMAYDLPTQLGYDPDHPRAEGEVGRVGFSACSLRDWEIAFDGLDLNKLGLYQVLNGPYLFGLACHMAIAEQQGVSREKLVGIGQNDILKEHIARNLYIFPPRQGLRLVTDSFEFVAKNLPLYYPITVSGVHISASGATPVHDATVMLSNAFSYLQAAVDRGVDIDAVGPHMMFVPCFDHYSFYEEIAKLRACRRIYASVLRERFKAKNPESWKARWYTPQEGSSLHKEQYLNNIVRTSIYVMGAALAGSQTADTRAYDEHFGIPTDEAIIQGLRAQHIVARETGITDVVDPFAGSYFMESLTKEMEERVLEGLAEADKRGGGLACIESGYFRKIIAKDAYQHQRKIERAEFERVGVNIFRSPEKEDKPTKVYRTDPAVERKRIESVQELRRKRDNAKVAKCLKEIKGLAASPESSQNNLFPAVFEAVKAYATIGEICEELRSTWGEFQAPSALT